MPTRATYSSRPSCRRESEPRPADLEVEPAKLSDAVEEPEPLRIALRLAFLSVLAFLPALGCGWVNWDDTANFLVNPWFRGLSWETLRWVWSARVLGVYQPLSWLMLEAEYSAWGYAPRGYHAVSLAWHAANALMLYRVGVMLIRRALPERDPADLVRIEASMAFAVALFAVHPLRAESVAWISAQPYLPSVFFALLSLWAYLRACESGQPTRDSRLWLAASWTAYAIALLFKTVAIGLPLVFLLVDVYPLGRLNPSEPLSSTLAARLRRVGIEKIPFLGLAIVFAAVASTSRAGHPAGLESRLAAAACAVWFYPIKTLWPFDLRALYTPVDVASFAAPLYRVCAAATVLTTLAVLGQARRWPALAVGWMSYLVLLAPTSGIVRIISAVAADRYSYFALMPLFVLAGGFLTWVTTSSASARLVRWSLSLRLTSWLLILGLVVLSWFQTATWKTSEMLWAHAVEHGADRVALAHHNLAEAMSEMGRLDDALGHYHRAAILRPDLPMSHLNLGMTLARLGRLSASIEPLTQSIRLDPRNAAGRHYLGLSLLRLGDLRGAELRLREALLLDPRDPATLNDLGLALMRQSRNKEAIRVFSEAIRLRPDFDEARHNLEEARRADSKVA